MAAQNTNGKFRDRFAQTIKITRSGCGVSVPNLGHTPRSSVISPLDSSATSCGCPLRVSVPLIARILKKKLKMRLKMIFFTIFTIIIMFLRGFHVTYVKTSLNVSVPLSSYLANQ